MADLQKSNRSTASVLLGAAFLMATSAIGPGFLTQTTVFTEQLKIAFAFAILVSVLIDIVVQLNIWRILAVSGMRGQDVANKVLPGLGFVLAFIVALGGLAFNIGNVGGAALGLNVLLGMEKLPASVISAAIAIIIFLRKDLGKAMDTFTKVLGFTMIAMVLYVAFVTKPPVGEAIKQMVMPEKIDWMVILTLVGGTVGGYITFAGAHRIIDAGITGEDNVGQITKGAVNGIAITGVMRFLMFLALLGVVMTLASGQVLDKGNPAADAFRIGAGSIGYKIFGVVLWAASITSVVGASYTSVSFLRSLFSVVEKYQRYWIIGFICASTSILNFLGSPVKLLVLAGSLNGLILPLSLGCVLLAAYKKEVVGNYHHPLWMTATGWMMVAFTAWMGITSLKGLMKLFG